MARKRLIDPRFFKHAALFDAEKASHLPLRLAYAGLWCQADRQGRFRWSPRELKLDVLPYDDADFGAVLRALEEHGFVRCYMVDGKAYGLIPTFSDWQSFHKTERPSTLPAPLVNRDLTVNDTAVTGTGTGTGTASPSGDEPRNDKATQTVLSLPPAAARKREGAPWMGVLAGIHAAERGAGSRLPAGSATTLRPLVDEFGVEEVALRYRRYLKATPARFHSLPKFAETFGSWTDGAAVSDAECILDLLQRKQLLPYDGNAELYRVRRFAALQALPPQLAARLAPAIERLNPRAIDSALRQKGAPGALAVIERALQADPAEDVA